MIATVTSDDSYTWTELLGDLPPDGVVAFIILMLVAFLLITLIFR